MGFAPDGHSGLQQVHTLDRDLDPPASAIGPVGQHPHKPSTFKGLEGRREGSPVHGQKGGEFADRGRVRAVERHQEGVLAIVEPERPERMVEEAGQRTGSPLGVQAKACLGDVGDDGVVEGF